jgi:hypothetical protein
LSTTTAPLLQNAIAVDVARTIGSGRRTSTGTDLPRFGGKHIISPAQAAMTSRIDPQQQATQSRSPDS